MNFSLHDIHLETERLLLRPFEQADFDTALPFYQEPEFRDAMEDDPPDRIGREYLAGAGRYMALRGYFFAIVEKQTGRTIGEVCLEWMNLYRANVGPGERVMRMPVGIWDKSLWGRGYGREVLACLMRYAFETLGIDRFCAMSVSTTNVRSQALFKSGGLRPVRVAEQGRSVDLEITREDYCGFCCSRRFE